MDLSALRDALDVTIEFHDACINGDLKKPQIFLEMKEKKLT